MTTNSAPRILITGVTGYVGGRLIHTLEEQGRNLCCLTRNRTFAESRVSDDTKIVEGDALNPLSLAEAMEGVDTAFYLIHSMGAASGFEEQDRIAAKNFAVAAKAAGVRRIVYLGGLGQGENLSPHLASRHEVGDILRKEGVQTIEFRASIIIGSGSLSFELLRALVNKLPVLITPRWVRMRVQPISIEDVIRYLVASLEFPGTAHEVFEIGGPDCVSCEELMREYARQVGVKRYFVPAPVITPYLSSLWLGLVTPVYARIGRKLIDSLPNETVVTNDLALKAFSIRPVGMAKAIERALINEDNDFAFTRWSDARSSAGKAKSWGGTQFGTRIVDIQEQLVQVPPEVAFRPIISIGGKNGWYFFDWLWRIRGFIDLLAGGVGLRRGRRDPENLVPGDSLDFWRVEAVAIPHFLRLHAEMKLPGRAWLQFEVIKTETGSRIVQTAIFDPHGLGGLLYWYGLYPLHALIFRGMVSGIAKRAERSGLTPPH